MQVFDVIPDLALQLRLGPLLRLNADLLRATVRADQVTCCAKLVRRQRADAEFQHSWPVLLGMRKARPACRDPTGKLFGLEVL